MTKRTATLSIYMSAARKLPDSATCVEISNYLRRPYQRNDTKQLMRERERERKYLLAQFEGRQSLVRAGTAPESIP